MAALWSWFLVRTAASTRADELRVQWPAGGLEESTFQLEAQLVLDAAARAKAIWPDDADVHEEPDQPAGGRAAGVWIGGGATGLGGNTQ